MKGKTLVWKLGTISDMRGMFRLGAVSRIEGKPVVLTASSLDELDLVVEAGTPKGVSRMWGYATRTEAYRRGTDHDGHPNVLTLRPLGREDRLKLVYHLFSA